MTEKEYEELTTAMIGRRFKFNYPVEFVTLPDYSARRGQEVLVLRKLTSQEAQPPSLRDGFTQMFLVQADDGWTGHAWEEELGE